MDFYNRYKLYSIKYILFKLFFLVFVCMSNMYILKATYTHDYMIVQLSFIHSNLLICVIVLLTNATGSQGQNIVAA